MKIILFDLGNTLEHKVQNKDFLMPGALELLSAVQDMRDHNGDAPSLALVSHFPFPKHIKDYPIKIILSISISNFESDCVKAYTIKNPTRSITHQSEPW